MFRRCQRQYAFRYDWEPGKELVPRVPKVQLYRGTWMHALQEEYHREWAGIDGASWERVHTKFTKQFATLFDEERAELGDLPGECYRLFTTYLKRYGNEDREKYEVILIDGKPAIETMVHVPLTKFGVQAPFKGKLDLIVRDREYGGVWIWDAKWVKRIPPQDERRLSPQAPLYVWAAKKHYGLDVLGFLYNYGCTKPPTPPQILQSGMISVAKKCAADYETWIQTIKQVHGDDWRHYAKTRYRERLLEAKARGAEYFDRVRIPVEPVVIKNALSEAIVTIRDIERRELTSPPRSYFYNCRFACDYHDLCVTEFMGLDISGLVKAKYTIDEERYGTEDLLNA